MENQIDINNDGKESKGEILTFLFDNFKKVILIICFIGLVIWGLTTSFECEDGKVKIDSGIKVNVEK